MLQPGAQVGRYEIQRRLGRGATGVVYVAHDPVLGRMVAIKIFSRDLDAPDARESFSREARAAAALSHPSIVMLLDFGEYESRPYIVMEYVPGETLAGFIKQKTPMAMTDKLRWMEELCEGARYAHQMQVVHRDIKPANLMIDRSRRLKILDFGVARMLGTAPTTGAMIATPGYMAPEQITGDLVDHRADQFSIGVIFYELLAYTEAFPGDTVPMIAHRILAEDPVPLSRLAPEAPPEIINIIERTLRKRSTERFPDTDSLRLAIAQVRRQFSSDSAEDTPTIAPSGDTPPSPSAPRGTGSSRRRQDDPGGVAHLTPPPDPRRTDREAIARRRTAPSNLDRNSGDDILAFEAVTRIEDVGTGAKAPAVGEIESARPLLRDEVQFTVYRPKSVKPGVWAQMLAFAHLADRRPNSPPNEPSPIERVRDIAKQALGRQAQAFRDTTEDAKQSVPREGCITLVPYIPGFEFNPDRREFRWTEDVHREDFRLRAGSQLNRTVARGQLAAYLGVMLLAEVNLSIRVDASPEVPSSGEESESITARPYRKIFASYSREDEEIVRQHEIYVKTLGDSYLRDVRDLRAGEVWDQALLRLINQADIFQLFWSWNAMRSEQVRREWEYALTLNRPAFIRPTYWESPLPESREQNLPPDALRRLQFHRIAWSFASDSQPTTPGTILTLEITAPREGRSRAESRKVFRATGGTIGRLSDNDWVLPDPYVSSHHARIRYVNGTFQIEDTSTNGVFINSPDNRLVRGQPYALKPGDRVLIEPYEIGVSLESRSDDPFGLPQPVNPFSVETVGPPVRSMGPPLDPYGAAPILEEQEVDPLKMLGGVPSAGQKPQRVKEQPPAPLWRDHYSPPSPEEPDEEVGASPGGIPIWYDPVVDAVPVRPAKPAASPPAPEKPRQLKHQPSPAQAPSEGPRAARDVDFLSQVLAGAGLDDKAVTPELAQDFGRILRIVVTGLMDVLQARQRTKDEFGMENTVFQPKDNNPLKFSANVEDALHNLLVKRKTAYLNPVDAFEDAFDDIRNHQIAMLAGVRVAFDALLARFDPDRLQEQFDRQKKGALVSLPARMRYWDLYRDWIHAMVHDADDSFRELFGEEFARAYDEQLERLKQSTR